MHHFKEVSHSYLLLVIVLKIARRQDLMPMRLVQHGAVGREVHCAGADRDPPPVLRGHEKGKGGSSPRRR